MIWRAILCACAPGAAIAGALFEPPAGCETYLTTQNRSCSVEHYYRCPDISADHQWRAAFDQNGPRYVSRIDRQAQWVTSGPAEDPERWVTLSPIRDAMSLDTLFEEKRDDFEFFQRRPGRPVEHLKGEDHITGEIEIDGEPLLTTSFWLERRDWNGEMIRFSTGDQFVSTRHRRFFGGIITITWPDGDVLDLNDTPVEFIYPGEDGFAATRPIYDCGVMSEAAQPRAIPAKYDVLAPSRANEERD